MLNSIITRGTLKNEMFIYFLHIPCMYKVITMNIKDVQNAQVYERRNIRINIRITPSQNKFILDNNLSITKVMNEALKQLGYIPPNPDEIPEKDLEREDGREYWKSNRGRGDRIAQRKRWKIRQKFKRKSY